MEAAFRGGGRARHLLLFARWAGGNARALREFCTIPSPHLMRATDCDSRTFGYFTIGPEIRRERLLRSNSNWHRASLSLYAALIVPDPWHGSYLEVLRHDHPRLPLPSFHPCTVANFNADREAGGGGGGPSSHSPSSSVDSAER